MSTVVTCRRSRLRTGPGTELAPDSLPVPWELLPLALLLEPRSARLQLDLRRGEVMRIRLCQTHLQSSSLCAKQRELAKRQDGTSHELCEMHTASAPYKALRSHQCMREGAHVAAWCMSTRLDGSMMLVALFLSLSSMSSAKVWPSNVWISSAEWLSSGSYTLKWAA